MQDLTRFSQIVDHLAATQMDALSRCEHCGQDGSVFNCDDCQANAAAFLSGIVDLANLIIDDTVQRFLFTIVDAPPNLEMLINDYGK